MRPKARTSLFHTMPEHTLRQIINESKSITDIFRKLKLRVSGAYFKIFHHAIETRAIDISHFTGKKPNLGNFRDIRPLEDIFRHGSYVSNTSLRHKVLKHKLIPYVCAKCSNDGHWQGEHMTLPLDHINGDRDDNRLENLRFLCPNCHSQTDTFCGKTRKKTYMCPDCSEPYHGHGQRCKKCSGKKNSIYLKKGGECTIHWPSHQEVHDMVWKEPLDKVAAKLGCSHTAVRKHCATHKISRPPMGYWERLRNGYSPQEALVSQKKGEGKAKRDQ